MHDLLKTVRHCHSHYKPKPGLLITQQCHDMTMCALGIRISQAHHIGPQALVPTSNATILSVIDHVSILAAPTFHNCKDASEFCCIICTQVWRRRGGILKWYHGHVVGWEIDLSARLSIPI